MTNPGQITGTVEAEKPVREPIVSVLIAGGVWLTTEETHEKELRKGEEPDEGYSVPRRQSSARVRIANSQSMRNGVKYGTLEPLSGRLVNLPQSRAWLALILVAELKVEFIPNSRCICCPHLQGFKKLTCVF